MSPNPKPITDYLTDFEAAPTMAPAARSAVPGGADLARHAPRLATHHVPVGLPPAANQDEVRGEDPAIAHAFAAGKEEGLKLAEARAALDRRRTAVEEERRAGERVAEAELRIGTMLAERLEAEIAEASARIEAELVACLVPVTRGLAERRAIDDLAAKAATIEGAARWIVSGPDRLVDEFLRRLSPPARARVERRDAEGIDVRVEIDAATLSTRLGELSDALDAL